MELSAEIQGPLYIFESVLKGIEVSGHQFLLEFHDFYIRVMFALHAQIVVADGALFMKLLNGAYYQQVVWQLAVKVERNMRKDPIIVLIFSDYNKLAQYKVICKKWDPIYDESIKWDKDRNCDPMDEWEKDKSQIGCDQFSHQLY